jgi:hypothetical protein
MVRCVSAGQRLDRTEFRSEVEWLDHVVQVAGYRCPHCAAEVEFLRRHFEAAARIAIDSRWRTAFDAARALRLRERGLDKTSDWDLLEVLEAGEWPEPIQT